MEGVTGKFRGSNKIENFAGLGPCKRQIGPLARTFNKTFCDSLLHLIKGNALIRVFKTVNKEVIDGRNRSQFFSRLKIFMG